jgi:dTDP-4-amino-4,6-dideoxygalactose transaminase
MLNEIITPVLPKIEFIDLHAQQRAMGKNLTEAIQKVLSHGGYILGPEVHELEKNLTAYVGVKETITCANGTDALRLVLMAKNIGPGDAVIVPTYTFASTAEVVAESKATPVFVDICPKTYNMSTESVEAALHHLRSTNLTPRGIIAVDLFGHPADYEALAKIAEKHNLWLMGDAAQSFGGAIQDKKVGNLTMMTTTSFFPSKPLAGYGDGGAIFTNDVELAKTLRSLRNHGCGVHRYDHIHIGLNSRLDTLQAAIINEKLKIFPLELIRRREIAKRYHELLEKHVTVPRHAPDVTHAWGLYTIICPHNSRETLLEELPKRDIPCNVYYRRPLHLQPVYQHYPRSAPHLSIAEDLSQRALSLPMHPYLTDAQVDYIAENVIDILKTLGY